jgi:hypothetical protein
MTKKNNNNTNNPKPFEKQYIEKYLDIVDFNLSILDEIKEGIQKRNVSFKRLFEIVSAIRFNNAQRVSNDVDLLNRELDDMEKIFLGIAKPKKRNFELLKMITLNAIEGVRVSLTDAKNDVNTIYNQL